MKKNMVWLFVAVVYGSTVSADMQSSDNALNSAKTTYYVSPSGDHVPPFSSWATAATNIQMAIKVAGAELIGFTLRNGEPGYSGGGAVCRNGGRIICCTVSDNKGTDGGNIYCQSGFVQNCRITDGVATRGGGLLLRDESTVDHCTISGNHARRGGGLASKD